MARYSYQNLPASLIDKVVEPALNLVICIPSYNEQDIESTLHSILDCEPIENQTEILVLINEPESCAEKVTSNNLETYTTCQKVKQANTKTRISIYPIYVSNIPSKNAGVGFARKLAMDEACRRLTSISKLKGGIVCLDADTLVASNYLLVLDNFFDSHQKYEACSIAFEHLLHQKDKVITDAIIQYELHLRYFISMQRLINLPFAYQTVGSAMGVTAQAYSKMGGMNTRKAGEDFYFLHKFIKNNLALDLTDTCVYPSPRISDRVPFGTGKAVGDIIAKDGEYHTYNPISFLIIEDFLNQLSFIYQAQNLCLEEITNLDIALKRYLEEQDFISKIKEMKNNTTDYISFCKRFFRWFDAFRLMKCLHYLRDKSYPNITINEAIIFLFPKLGFSIADELEDNLTKLREYDRTTVYKEKAY